LEKNINFFLSRRFDRSKIEGAGACERDTGWSRESSGCFVGCEMQVWVVVFLPYYPNGRLALRGLQAAKKPKPKGFPGHNPPKTGGPTTTEITAAH